MKQQLAGMIFAALAASTTCAAHADDSGTYLGMALSSSRSIDAVSRGGAVVESGHSGFAGRLYGGYRVNRALALEAGYASYGSYTLADVGPGAAGDARIKPASVYAAVKGTYPVSDSVDLFGKVNLVHTRVELAGLGSGDVSMNRVLLGVGAEYRITPQWGLTLEVTRHGNVHVPRVGRLNLNRVEAGVNVRF